MQSSVASVKLVGRTGAADARTHGVRKASGRARGRARKGSALKRLTIAHVLAAGPYGGLESVVSSLARGLEARGHRVPIVLVLDEEPRPHPFEQALLDAGREVHALPLPPRAYRAERAGLRAALDGLEPDVVHSHGYRADIQLGTGARLRAARPTVTTLHGFTGGGLRMRVYEALQIRALRRFSAVIAVSAPIRERVVRSGVPGDRVHLIRNAWQAADPPLASADARRALGLPLDGPVVGWVGRLSREKGADLLLEAMARMKTERVHVCFVGDGPEEARLREAAARLGLADRVVWAGPRPRAASLFRAFDVLALSSRTEGTPIVLFEATHAGIPVVATRVGGVPDVLGAEQALLVDPESPAALAEALDRTLEPGPETRARVEVARARVASDFGVEPWLDRHERLYAELAAAPGSAAARAH